MRNIVKKMILIYYKLCKLLPKGSTDILIIETFEGFHDEVQKSLDGKVIKLKFSLLNMPRIIYHTRYSKLILIDNINIVNSSIVELKKKTIMNWHASNAVKKFGLSTLEEGEKQNRTIEYNGHGKIIVGSEQLANAMKECLGKNDEDLIRMSSICGNKVWENIKNINNDSEYILYVPTFRKDEKQNKAIINFINQYDNDKYVLKYKLHPKVNVNINNPQALEVERNLYSNIKGAHLVISDYSSLLIDASALNENVMMFASDYDEYINEQGLFITKEKFWGQFESDKEMVMRYISEDKFIEHSKDDIIEKYFEYETNQGIKQIIQYINERLCDDKKS